MTDDVRKIRFPVQQGEKLKRRHLWRVIGYDPFRQQMVIENPYTRERFKYFCKTWEGGKCAELDRDVYGRYEYVDPPPPRTGSHSDICACHICKPYRVYEKEQEEERKKKAEAKERIAEERDMEEFGPESRYIRNLRRPTKKTEVDDDFGQPGD